MSIRIKTLGELKDSNWKSKTIKDELRDNLIKKILISILEKLFNYLFLLILLQSSSAAREAASGKSGPLLAYMISLELEMSNPLF